MSTKDSYIKMDQVQEVERKIRAEMDQAERKLKAELEQFKEAERKMQAERNQVKKAKRKIQAEMDQVKEVKRKMQPQTSGGKYSQHDNYKPTPYYLYPEESVTTPDSPNTSLKVLRPPETATSFESDDEGLTLTNASDPLLSQTAPIIDSNFPPSEMSVNDSSSNINVKQEFDLDVDPLINSPRDTLQQAISNVPILSDVENYDMREQTDFKMAVNPETSESESFQKMHSQGKKKKKQTPYSDKPNKEEDAKRKAKNEFSKLLEKYAPREPLPFKMNQSTPIKNESNMLENTKDIQKVNDEKLDDQMDIDVKNENEEPIFVDGNESSEKNNEHILDNNDGNKSSVKSNEHIFNNNDGNKSFVKNNEQILNNNETGDNEGNKSSEKSEKPILVHNEKGATASNKPSEKNVMLTSPSNLNIDPKQPGQQDHIMEHEIIKMEYTYFTKEDCYKRYRDMLGLDIRRRNYVDLYKKRKTLELMCDKDNKCTAENIPVCLEKGEPYVEKLAGCMIPTETVNCKRHITTVTT